MRALYLLPIRRDHRPADCELIAYVRWVATVMPVVVVDGSPAEIFAAHASAWGDIARHLPVDADVRTLNGKVAGVLTGLRRVADQAVVIADDDVRYDADSLADVVRALVTAHVVRPQNYFAPLPWHARWDTGRILINRALDGDWPGTLAVRGSVMRATGGYAGDVLFENLELVRTVVAAGGTQRLAREILVRRLPPRSNHFWGQRVRQAYDEFARPWRLVAQLAVLPVLVLLALTGGVPALVGCAAVIISLAEFGRRRDGGRRVFPFRASLLAPAWVLERAITSWLALATRVLHGGVRYAGTRVARAATPMRELERRHAGAVSAAPASAVPPSAPRRRSA